MIAQGSKCVCMRQQTCSHVESNVIYTLCTVRLEKLFRFCYRCTFLKRRDHLRSVPFCYRSPFRFFCRLRLNGTVSPPFLGTCNTYVRTYYVHRRDTDKTYASCWLARITVGSLVLQCLRRTAITQISTTTRASNLGIYHEN